MGTMSGKIKSEVLIALLVAAAIVTAIVVLVRFDTTGEKGSGLEQDFIYDIGDRVKIDPNLILYAESSERISTGLSKSYGIATDTKGGIYVAGEGGVGLFDSKGESTGEIELDGTARCVALVEDSVIYIGMRGHVEVYDIETKQLTRWESLGEDAVLTSVAVWRGDVFVADAGNRIVLRYDNQGNLINRIGHKDKARNIPGFVVPSPYFDLSVGRDGLLRVVNPGRHRIEAYTFDGDLEFFWGVYSPDVEGFCGCCNPVNFSILGDDSFVTCEKGLVRIKIYDADGVFAGVVAGPEQLRPTEEPKICQVPAQCQVGGFDVAVDNQQRILVLDTIDNVVRVFEKIEAN